MNKRDFELSKPRETETTIQLASVWNRETSALPTARVLFSQRCFYIVQQEEKWGYFWEIWTSRKLLAPAWNLLHDIFLNDRNSRDPNAFVIQLQQSSKFSEMARKKWHCEWLSIEIMIDLVTKKYFSEAFEFLQYSRAKSSFTYARCGNIFLKQMTNVGLSNWRFHILKQSQLHCYTTVFFFLFFSQ